MVHISEEENLEKGLKTKSTPIRESKTRPGGDDLG